MCTLFFSIGRGLSGGIGIRPCQKRQQSEGCTKVPSLYCVSIFLDFFWPTLSPYVIIFWTFSDPPSRPMSAKIVLNASKNCHFFWPHPFSPFADVILGWSPRVELCFCNNDKCNFHDSMEGFTSAAANGATITSASTVTCTLIYVLLTNFFLILHRVK